MSRLEYGTIGLWKYSLDGVEEDEGDYSDGKIEGGDDDGGEIASRMVDVESEGMTTWLFTCFPDVTCV